MVESFWFAPRDRDLLSADLAGAGRSVAAEVRCQVDAATARQRCRGRRRHPVHHAAHEDEQLWRQWAQRVTPLGLGPTMRVSTAEAVDTAALCRLVRPLVEPEVCG